MAHNNTSHVVHFIYIGNRLSQNMCLTNVHIAPEEFFGAEHHIAQCTNQETHSILELFQMRQNHLLSLQHVEHWELRKHHSLWSLVALEQDQFVMAKPVGLKDCHPDRLDSQMPLHMLDICQSLLVFDSHCSPENQVERQHNAIPRINNAKNLPMAIFTDCCNPHFLGPHFPSSFFWLKNSSFTYEYLVFIPWCQVIVIMRVVICG